CFQAEDGIRDRNVTGVQTCALPIFSHTPWAPPEYFRLLPTQVARELLEGMLGADHLGFHSPRWANAFLRCCAEILGSDVDLDRRTVEHGGRVVKVNVHPLGADAEEMRRNAA